MSTKLTRQTLYQFGSTVNGASEVGVFGSGAISAPDYTSSITLMQSLAAWDRGWAAETIANNRPFLEDMNAVDCVFGYQLSYMLQMGIPEYDTSGNTFYFLHSLVQSGGIVYQVINDNGGAGISATAPGNATYWKVFVQVSGVLGTPSTTYSVATVYQAPTDLLITVNGLVQGNDSAGVYIKMDPINNPPTAYENTTASGSSTTGAVVNSPFYVPKGYYWEYGNTFGSGGLAIIAVPLGT